MQNFPDMIVRGTATSAPPKIADLAGADLAAIRERAETTDDQQLKTDLFRLLAELDRLR